MFSDQQYTGHALPHKTVCLTFDDGPGESKDNGPGPKTVQLAQYLWEQGICATFFMVGKFIDKYPSIPQEVSRLGHIIGNHTYSHQQPLPDQLTKGEDVISEIAATDQLIKQYCRNNTIYFRAPWGIWSAAVAAHLNENINNGLEHIGPVNWDIDSNDWAYWRDGGSAEDCAQECLDKIQELNGGILLMHDSTADIDHIRENNRTLETIRILVPQLKALGYQFAGLDKLSLTFLGRLATTRL